MDALDQKGVLKVFSAILWSRHIALLLKAHKTTTSIRKVFLPKRVVKMLIAQRHEQLELIELFGDEYINNDLIFCSSNGRPMESQIINCAFNKLVKDHSFTYVFFNSFKHSSIIYKHKLSRHFHSFVAENFF